MAKPDLDAIFRDVDVNGKGLTKEEFTVQYKADLENNTSKLPSPSSNYVALVSFLGPPNRVNTPFRGDAVDVLGFGAEANIDAGNNLTAWATPNYFSTVAGSSQGASIQKRKIDFNLATDSIIFAFKVKMSPPATNQPLMGNGLGAVNGVYISARSNGKIQLHFITGGIVTTNVADSIATVLDNTDHSVLIAIDGPKSNAYVYIDGVLDTTYKKINPGPTPITYNWKFGSSTTSATITSSFTGYFHFLKFTGYLPFGFPAAALKIHLNPTSYLTVNDLQIVSRSMVVTIIGQSNEYGAGTQFSASGPFAAPQYDPLPHGTGVVGRPAGGVRSMWPTLATLAAKRGAWADFYNCAVGSTSIVHNWCGILRQWVNGMLVVRGTYVLAGGNVYKNETGASKYAIVPAVSSSQPTGTAASQTLPDGQVWAYKGAARAQDIAGYIYPHTDAYFDPNAFCSEALASVSTRIGYDEKWMFLSIGQGDKTMNTVRTEYALGLRRVVDYFLANNIKVALGFTCYAGTAGAEAWYQSDLLPGYADALAAYSGNANVIPGANLRTALGVLTSVGGDEIGLQSDLLHMNNPTLTLAAEAWRDALVTASVI